MYMYVSANDMASLHTYERLRAHVSASEARHLEALFSAGLVAMISSIASCVQALSPP
jgi:hypothetical protein